MLFTDLGHEFEAIDMMLGIVNRNCEATIRIVVGNESDRRQMIDAVIDTGFTGFLSLPSALISTLELPWIMSNVGTLGDGSETIFDIYAATVIWDGQSRSIDVAESEAEPLVGMSLLYGYRLQIEAIEGGRVAIEALS